jgi:hypothetical protein
MHAYLKQVSITTIIDFASTVPMVKEAQRSGKKRWIYGHIFTIRDLQRSRNKIEWRMTMHPILIQDALTKY